jgi:hypothetical protein
MKLALVSFALLFVFQAGAADQIMMIHSKDAYVVPGISSDCTDMRSGQSPIPMSVSSDFFKINMFKLIWTSEQQLVPAAIKLTMKSPHIESGHHECVISGKLLEDTLGGSTFSSGMIDMNNPLNGAACSLACGGMKRSINSPNHSFTTNAELEFIGYSMSADGEQMTPIRSKSTVRLSFL